MRKITILVIIAVAFCGCTKPNVNNFSTVEYSGHTYIVYNGNSYDGGITHNPDCKCGRIKKQHHTTVIIRR